MTTVPIYEPRNPDEIFHAVCCIQYRGPKAHTLVDSWDPKDSSITGQLRTDLSMLKLPLVKVESVRRCNKHGKALELWWRERKGMSPLHASLQKALSRLATSALPVEIASIKLYYIPGKHEVLYPTWKPRWSIQNTAAPSPYTGVPPVTPGPAMSAFAQGNAFTLPITPQSAFPPVMVPAATASTHIPGPYPGTRGTFPVYTAPVYAPKAPTYNPSAPADPSSPAYKPATPVWSPDSPMSVTRSPVYAASTSSPASYTSPVSSQPASPILDESATLLSVCLSELVERPFYSDWQRKQAIIQRVTQPLFDAEPQHRPNFDSRGYIGQDDIRRAIVKALCSRAECASELETQLQEAIVKNREASVNNVRDVVAAETRAQELQGALEAERSKRATLSAAHISSLDQLRDVYTALDQSRQDNERLSSQVEWLQLECVESVSQRESSEAACKAVQTLRERDAAASTSELKAAQSKLGAAEDKISRQQLALSTATERNGRLQSDLARVEEQRKTEQADHARETREMKESWQVERTCLYAELEAIRAEKVRPFVTPALMEAFLGVNDMVRLATS
ncbi:hypothetical protein PENSPDRAFT_683324 [Peniophora sp. CONT]|nr:hypothetical protein PENSPDRAFT_683324 [Peniophora sp. CONT]